MNKATIIFFLLFSIDSYSAFELGGDLRLQTRQFHGRPSFEKTQGRRKVISIARSRARAHMDWSGRTARLFLKPQWNDHYRTSGTFPVSQNKIEKNFLHLHEGFTEYKFNNDFRMTIGRQALDIMEGRLLGSAEWTNWNRSYDSLSFDTFFNFHYLQALAFVNNGDERMDVLGLGKKHKGVSLLYKAHPNWIDQITFHYLYNEADSNVADIFHSFSIDLKHKGQSFFHQWTLIGQRHETQSTQFDNSYLVEVELGSFYGKNHRNQVSLSVGQASKDFNTLFGSGLRLKGMQNDFFSGSNLSDYALHADIFIGHQHILALDYHHFRRTDNDSNSPVISKENNAVWLAAAGKENEAHLGDEIDFMAIYKYTKNSTISMGYSLFMPGAYFRHSAGHVTSQLSWADIKVFF